MRLGADITTTRRAIWLSVSVLWVIWIVFTAISGDFKTLSAMVFLAVIIVPFNYFQIVFLLWLGRTLERIIWKQKGAWE